MVRRPKLPVAHDTIEVLFEAVRRILTTKKIEDLRGTEICRIAGVSAGTLYQYFRNVDDLIAAWELRELEASTSRVVDCLVAMKAAAEANAAAGVPPRSVAENVVELAELGIAILRRFLNFYRLPAESRLLRRAEARSAAVDACADLLATALREIPADLFIPEDAVQAARIVVHAVASAAIFNCEPGTDYRQHDREVARMVSRYLVNVPPP